MKSRKTTLTIRYVRIGEWVMVATLGDVGRDAAWRSTRCGNSGIKRAAIVAESGHADGPAGRAASSEANFRVAASPGNRANAAASSQGSTSRRASADRTLSSIPLL